MFLICKVYSRLFSTLSLGKVVRLYFNYKINYFCCLNALLESLIFFSVSNIAKSYFHLQTELLLFYLKFLEAITIQTFTYASKQNTAMTKKNL